MHMYMYYQYCHVPVHVPVHVHVHVFRKMFKGTTSLYTLIIILIPAKNFPVINYSFSFGYLDPRQIAS